MSRTARWGTGAGNCGGGVGPQQVVCAAGTRGHGALGGPGGRARLHGPCRAGYARPAHMAVELLQQVAGGAVAAAVRI